MIIYHSYLLLIYIFVSNQRQNQSFFQFVLILRNTFQYMHYYVVSILSKFENKPGVSGLPWNVRSADHLNTFLAKVKETFPRKVVCRKFGYQVENDEYSYYGQQRSNRKLFPVNRYQSMMFQSLARPKLKIHFYHFYTLLGVKLILF